jgi:hypothetical protein
MKAKLFRENKGWVLVFPHPVTADVVDQIREYWSKVSDLPIVVFSDVDLLVRDDGSIVVKEVIIVPEEKRAAGGESAP